MPRLPSDGRDGGEPRRVGLDRVSASPVVATHTVVRPRYPVRWCSLSCVCPWCLQADSKACNINELGQQPLKPEFMLGEPV
jgi:hypothetical protein